MPDGRGSDGLLIAAPAGAPVKAVADGTRGAMPNG